MPSTTPNPVLNEKWLLRAAWWVAHKQLIKTVVASVVLVVSSVALLYDAYAYLDYWVFSRERDQRMYDELSQLQVNLNAISRPQPIGLSNVVVLTASRTNDHFDVLAKLVNRNEKWIANVTVHLAASDNQEGIDVTTTLLNKDEQFILGPGLALSPSATAEAKITSIEWHRLKYPDELNQRKPKLVVTDVRFRTAAELNLAGDTQVSQVSFAVENQSIFNFWSVDFTVVLLEGDTPIAASKTTVSKLMAQEKRELSLNFYTVIPAATTVLVIPSVNVSDDSVFMKIPGPPIRFQ